jgi:hypothetical protein
MEATPFKKEALEAAREAVTAVYHGDVDVSLRRVKVKEATDREHWRDFQSITRRPGLTWDKNPHTLTADDELWDPLPEPSIYWLIWCLGTGTSVKTSAGIGTISFPILNCWTNCMEID